MAKEANKQNQATPQSSAGRGLLDTLMILVAIAALVGGVFAFYYFQNQWQPLERFGVLAAGIIIAFGLLALTNFGRMAWQYIKGARIELKKITWPTRPELWQTTLAVLVVVTITAIILFAFDSAVDALFDWLIYNKG